MTYIKGTTRAQTIFLRALAKNPNGPPRHAPLRRRDWLLGVLLSLAFIAAVAHWFGDSFARPHSFPTICFLAIPLGPGTLLALLLRRRRAGSALIGLAILLNFACFYGAMIFLGVRELARLR